MKGSKDKDYFYYFFADVVFDVLAAVVLDDLSVF